MSSLNEAYSAQFYCGQQAGSKVSAEIVLPIVLGKLQPTSVVDVGCGVGTWLAVARSLGVDRALGLEGAWVQGLPPADASLQILVVDLEQPLKVEESFDLAICMEVAEHLTPGRAASFVRDLCGLAPYVLFSAAVPGQGGANHQNEQWQSYWAALFRENRYNPLDIVRPAVWDNDAVAYWYRQNALLYSSANPPDISILLDVVHPSHGRDACIIPTTKSLKGAIKETYEAASHIPGAAWRAVARRLPRINS